MYTPIYSVEYSALYFSSDSMSSQSPFSGGRNVFVCGALQNPAKVSALLGLEPPFAPAAATGYRRTVERIDGEDVPFMVPDQDDPRSVLTGVAWLDLTSASLEKIEALELERGFRKRIAIEARVGELSLSVYSYVKR
jgi:hypothetical protein